jgi:predicted nucleic acid-binding protein
VSAIQTGAAYRVSFWNSLIIAAAGTAGAGILYTEDLNHNQRYGNVLVQNHSFER